MWVRKRIDIGWSDIAYGLVRCCHSPRRTVIQNRLEQWWSPDGDTLTCLSVRSGFDLLWQALQLPAGSEVLMTAVTIPDMVRIVKHHGLTPVPIDLDMSRMSPKLDAVRRAITPRTRAIVVAHLFGTRVPLEPLAQIAREHGLLLVEDCAQVFAGDRYKGHADADVSMFSFGPIKTCTALAGAVFRVGDPQLLARLKTLHDEYCVQRKLTYFRRLLKYTAIKCIASRPIIGAIARTYRCAGSNHDTMANHMARGFAGPDFFPRIRKQPSTPLLAVMERRLRTFDHALLERRAARGRLMVDLLGGAVPLPGSLAAFNTFWVLPVVAEHPDRLLDKLWRAGFDATQGESMQIVEPPDGREAFEPADARETNAKIVYLPFYPQMSLRALRRMAKVVIEECGESAERRKRRFARRFAMRRSLPDDRRRWREIVKAKFSPRQESGGPAIRKRRRRKSRKSSAVNP